jgi:hypothetical protein
LIIAEFEADRQRIDSFILSYKELEDSRKKFPALQDADDFKIITDSE